MGRGAWGGGGGGIASVCIREHCSEGGNGSVVRTRHFDRRGETQTILNSVWLLTAQSAADRVRHE
jgi:hypothetical protein